MAEFDAYNKAILDYIKGDSPIQRTHMVYEDNALHGTSTSVLNVSGSGIIRGLHEVLIGVDNNIGTEVGVWVDGDYVWAGFVTLNKALDGWPYSVVDMVLDIPFTEQFKIYVLNDASTGAIRECQIHYELD